MNGINESCFISTLLPKQKIAYLKMLEHVDAKLLPILIAELNHGNKILNVLDQSSDEGMVVMLSQPFKKKYETDGLQFGSSTNPHDGGEYYSTTQPNPYTLTAPLKR